MFFFGGEGRGLRGERERGRMRNEGGIREDINGENRGMRGAEMEGNIGEGGLYLVSVKQLEVVGDSDEIGLCR